MNWTRAKWYAGHVAGIAIMVIVVGYVARPSPHVPPYDANLVRLAETPRQGYCAGVILWRSGDGSPDADAAATCRKQHLADESGEVSLAKTERAFCRAIVDQGWDGTVTDCLGILAGQQLWPTYDGTITDQWNRARPYPKPALASAEAPDDDSRTGTRSENPGRGYYPGG